MGKYLWKFLLSSILCFQVALTDWSLQAFWQGGCDKGNYCEHTCIPVDNGYICDCQESYQLRSDGYSCQRLADLSIFHLGHVGGVGLPDPLSEVSLSSSSGAQLNEVQAPGKQAKDTEPVVVGMKDDREHMTLGAVHNAESLMSSLSCQDIVCKNNGTCVQDQFTARCNCPMNTGGSRCEKDKDIRYPKFSGNGYVALPVLKTGYQDFEITIEFKTPVNNGLLMFSSEDGRQIDFFSIVILNGFVEFRFDCGSGPAVVRSISQVNIGAWNRVKVRRQETEGLLWLNDDLPVRGVSKGSYSRITLRLPVFIGGYENMPSIVRLVGTTKPFVGCVQRVIINDYRYDLRKKDLVGDSIYGLNVDECSEDVCVDVTCQNGGTCVARSADQHVCLCPLGKGGENCEYDTTIHIPEFKGHSYLQHEGLGRTSLSYLEIEMVFKPQNPEGVVLYNGFTHDRKGDYVSLAMRDGYLEFKFDLGTGPAVLKSSEKLTLGAWHWVKVSRTGREGIMKINNQLVVQALSNGAFTQLTLMKDLFIGGHSNFDHTAKGANLSLSFQGCIQKGNCVVINGHQLKLIDDATFGVNVEACDHPCRGEPCLNHGQCVPDHDLYKCHCPLGFTNTNCEDRIESNVAAIQLDGYGYLSYTSSDIVRRVNGNKISLSLQIRPKSKDGLLFWTSKDQPITGSSDFMALGFVDGELQFRYNLGSGEAVIRYNHTKLFDGDWHHVLVERDEVTGLLEIDYAEVIEGSSAGSYTVLNTNNVVYIGGVPEVAKSTSRKFSMGFSGCLKDVQLSQEYDVQLITDAIGGQNVKACPAKETHNHSLT